MQLPAFAEVLNLQAAAGLPGLNRGKTVLCVPNDGTARITGVTNIMTGLRHTSLLLAAFAITFVAGFVMFGVGCRANGQDAKAAKPMPPMPNPPMPAPPPHPTEFVADSPTPTPVLSGLKVEVAPRVYAAGDLIVLRAETSCKRATWIVPETIKQQNVDPNDNGLKLTLVAPTGRHVLYCVVAPAADTVEVAKVVLQVEGGPDDPPGPAPGPGPGPKPPNPNPNPADPFQADLRKLFEADQSPGKRPAAANLAALYRLAVGLCDDKSLATCDELLGQIADAAKTLAADAIVPVRRRVADELGKLASPDAELTDALRPKLASVFARAAAALEELTK